MFSLENKNVFITGGGSGIGLAIARRFVRAGANIVVADIRQSDDVRELGVDFCRTDVSRESQVAAAFEFARLNIGLLDVVINNAGIALDEGPIQQLAADTIEKMLEVNLKGVLYGLKHAPGYMRDKGAIINTASLAASVTIPEYTVYSVTKASVVSMTRNAAVELAGRGIRVNAVCPGTTITPMEPGDGAEAKLCRYTTCAGRPATAEEQAAVFHFLASDDASYINAQAINVDGGWINGLTGEAAGRLSEVRE